MSHFFYHRYILEYYNTLSIGNWIIILESLLLEQSIIFYSSRVQRITSCILASLSLLYPLMWPHLIYPLLPADCIEYVGCPTPFVAGVHTDLIEDIKPLVNYGARLIDLDNDIVYGAGETGTCLPMLLRQWLLRQCNESHTAILRHIHNSENVAFTTAAFLVEPYSQLMAILLGGYRSALQHTQPSSSFIDILKSGNSDYQIQTARFDEAKPDSWYFDRNLFIMSRGKDLQNFLTQLLNSQMVVQFIESRVNLLNSELSVIPSDEFEDCIDRVQIPTRFNMSDLVKLGRIALERFVRKFKKSDKKRLKIGCHEIYRSNSLKVPMKISAPLRNGKPILPNYATYNKSSRLINKEKSDQSPNEPQLTSSLNDKLQISKPDKKNNTTNATTVQLRHKVTYEENQKSLPWESLTSSICTDKTLNKSERNTRSLLTSILAEMPNIEKEWPDLFNTTQSSNLTGNQLDLTTKTACTERKKSNECQLMGNVTQTLSSPPKPVRKSINENSNSEFYKNWLKFESASTTCGSFKNSLFDNLIDPNIYIDPIKAFDIPCLNDRKNKPEPNRMSESPKSLSEFDPFPITKTKE